MKYYEFEVGDFPYCALIAANNVEDAKNTYILNVYELNDFDGEPTEVNEEMAFSILEKVYTVDNDMEDVFDFIKSQFSVIRESKVPYLLLIDSDLDIKE